MKGQLRARRGGADRPSIRSTAPSRRLERVDGLGFCWGTWDMRITRFFDTAEGGSRFEEIEAHLPEKHTDAFGNSFPLSRAIAAEDAVLVELPAGLDQSWHNAPHRQLVFVLSGAVEVETTDGEQRGWRGGEFFLAEDTDGKGHLTRVIEGPARVLFVRVSPEFGLANWGRA